MLVEMGQMVDRPSRRAESTLCEVISRLHRSGGKPGRDLAAVLAVAKLNNDGVRATVAEVDRTLTETVGFNHRQTAARALESAERAGFVENRSDGHVYDYAVNPEAAVWLVACLEHAATELRALELLDEPGGER